MRRTSRAALLLSLAGLTACGGNHMAPVAYHHQGRLQSDEASASSPTGAPASGDAISPVASTHVDRQSLEVTSSSLPPPVSYSSSSSLPPPASAPLVVQAPPPQPRSSLEPSMPSREVSGDVIVRRGDTVYSIARAHSVNRNELIALNGLHTPFALKPGSRLKLPGTRVASNTHGGAAEGGPLLRMGEMPPPPASAPAGIDPPTNADIIVARPSDQGFIWPVNGKIISDFGFQTAGHKNDGIDIAVPEGTAVHAARAGEVIYAGSELKGYGNLVLIRHDDGYVSAYAHNSRLMVKRGQTVKRGQHIADSGSTGSVGQPQVHFEIRKDRRPVNPEGYLPRA